MTSAKPVAKQVQRLLRNVDNFSNGQASVPAESLDFDDLSKLNVVVSPTAGPYRGGSFTFLIDVANGFPDSAPYVTCTTIIYHPNIDETGSLCFSLLDDDWEPTLTLEDVVQGLLFLMYHPNVRDPLSPYFGGGEGDLEFRRNVRKTLRGGKHFDVEFPRNLDQSYEDDELSGETDWEPCSLHYDTDPDYSDWDEDDEDDDEYDDESSFCEGKVDEKEDTSKGVDLARTQSELSINWDTLEKLDASADVEDLRPERRSDSNALTTLKRVGRHLLRSAVELFIRYG